jgi:hypothetical protein
MVTPTVPHEALVGSAAQTTFRMPPRIHRADGVERLVGVEVEFGGLDITKASQLVQDLYGGVIERKDRFVGGVRGTRWGDFRVEIDSQPLKNHRYRSILEALHTGETVVDAIEGVLETIARQWIPSEIVFPPIGIRDVHVAELLRKSLRNHHAEGSLASPLYTFAFQLNPEAPALDPTTLRRYFQAFLALQDWLLTIVDVDPTRRLTSFVDPFSEAYRRRVLDPAYAPDMDTLIDDYLDANPTRNRALDLLPLFAFIDEKRVMERASEPAQVKPRPTFHYRLPNCLVDDPTWSFALEWNRWVEIERLAEDPDRLRTVSREAMALLDDAEKGNFDGDRHTVRQRWVEQGERWGLAVE